MLEVKEFFYKIRGDLLFAVILIICLFFSLILRRFAPLLLSKCGTVRALDGVIGFLLVAIVTRGMIFCSLIIVLAHLIFYRLIKCPKLLVNISFYVTFLYLSLLRLMHFIGLPPLVFIANGVQLIMTLRVIGLSYEISDFRIAKQKAKEAKDGKGPSDVLRVIPEPTTFDSFNYLFGFVGLFTGPYYTYRTFFDSNKFGQITTKCMKSLIYEKISKLYWSLPLLLAFSWLDPVDGLRGEKINNYGKIYLLILSALAFIYFRMRIYTAWMISESICIAAGIGVYPKQFYSRTGSGPEIFDAQIQGCDCNAETISNLDIPKIEYSDGFRSGMRAWNRTVQFWLANFVYKRSSKLIRMPYTMFISAFWHGIHPGYFLSFLTIPFCTTAEDLLFEVFPLETRSYWISIIWSFIRMRSFDFLACGFLLLTWSDTIRLWSNLFFYVHLIMIFTILLMKFYLIFFKQKKNIKKC